MPQIKGRITVSETQQRRQIRIISHEIHVGEVLLANNRPGFTKFSAWVPKPTDVAHIPGIYLSLSNPSGRAFVRLNKGDLSILIQSLTDWQSTLQDAETISTDISEQLKELDRKIHKEHPLINYGLSDITGVNGASAPLGLDR